jgi:hypothetical protein
MEVKRSYLATVVIMALLELIIEDLKDRVTTTSLIKLHLHPN